MFLRQSTSQIIRFGPFLDSTDGVTAETALTIAQADMQLSKDGGAFAQKNTTGNATHDTDGWYSTTIDTTDTNTVGELYMQVNVAGALPVWVRYWVIEEAIYDALYGAAASGFDASSNVTLAAVTHTGATIPSVTTTTTATNLTNLPSIPTNWITATGISASALNGKGDWNIGKTGYSISGTKTTLDALNDISVNDILTTQMTESYAANGTAPTIAQALFLIQQILGDFNISGTTLTVKEIDGTTTAATFTLNDGTNPTGHTRSS